MLYYTHRKEVNTVSDLIDMLKALIAGLLIEVIKKVADELSQPENK